MKKLQIWLAFTLAEVLIILGIIGVVAEMTIPTLIANYQKTIYITGVKKAYSEFYAALTDLSQDKDCGGDLACTGLFALNTNSDTFGKELAKHFRIVKNCGIAKNLGCWPPITYQNYDKIPANHYNSFDNVDSYKFITADGMSYYVANSAISGAGYEDCKYDRSSGVTGQMKNICGVFFVDVNGPKGGPNIIGRDTFIFWITNTKGLGLYPAGGQDDSYLWWNASGNQTCVPENTDSDFCTGRVVEEGWQMNY